MKPTHIRCATMPNGDIEASDIYHGGTDRVIVNCQSGNAIYSTVRPSSDMFRWLVTAARKHVAK